MFLLLEIQSLVKYIVAWLNHDEFGNLIVNNLNRNSLWTDNVAHFSQVATTWNREVFGNTHKRKMRLINRLHGVQRALLNDPNPYLEDLQNKLWLDYETILFEEETLWFQKSWCKWISMGDCNTKYFHLFALAKRRRDCILALKVASDTWVHEPQIIKQMVRVFL